MTTNVFEIWSSKSTVPLTVYADDSFEAENAYYMWCLVHRLEWAETPAKLEHKDEQWFAERTQLATAIERAKQVGLHDGVCQWLGHEAGWVVASELSPQLGRIAPPEPVVRCFTVRIEHKGITGVDALVFARTPEQAESIYLQHMRQYKPKRYKSLAVEEFSRWRLLGDQTILREQMDMGMEGIAHRSGQFGWSIYPPECDPTR